MILVDVRSFRDGCLGEKEECALETAVRALRSEKFRDFVRIAEHATDLCEDAILPGETGHARRR